MQYINHLYNFLHKDNIKNSRLIMIDVSIRDIILLFPNTFQTFLFDEFPTV